ncbi:MAG: hypothetical protein WA177_23625 [Xanthobacteraceae bacterium]
MFSLGGSRSNFRLSRSSPFSPPFRKRQDAEGGRVASDLGQLAGIEAARVTAAIPQLTVDIARALCSIFDPLNPPGERTMRKEFALLASIAAVFTVMAFSAQAMPAAALKGATNSSQVIKVAGGCGHGWHRGPYGHCRRN